MSTTYTALVTLKHAASALEYLQKHVRVSTNDNCDPLSPADLRAKLVGQDAVMSIMGDRLDAGLIQACPDLKVIANVAVGYDNVDVEAATSHGVLVCNTPGVLDNTTADMAFALLLAAARRIAEADHYVRSGSWQHVKFNLLLGHDLYGKTLGIIGLGRIGQCVARRARGFDMKVLYSQRNRLSSRAETELNATYTTLDQLLQQSDFVSVNCPLTKETRHLIGDEQFALMKPSGIIVNTARGAIIDEKALVKALQAGSIAGAGLDVFEEEPHPAKELLTMENVVLAPHIGSASLETREAMANLAAKGLVTALSGNMPSNTVNPAVWPEFSKRLKKHSDCHS
jgi:D-3-phosphoglycerate dehydrogenase